MFLFALPGPKRSAAPRWTVEGGVREEMTCSEGPSVFSSSHQQGAPITQIFKLTFKLKQKQEILPLRKHRTRQSDWHTHTHTEGLMLMLAADSSVWDGCSLWYWDMRLLKAHTHTHAHMHRHTEMNTSPHTSRRYNHTQREIWNYIYTHTEWVTADIHLFSTSGWIWLS